MHPIRSQHTKGYHSPTHQLGRASVATSGPHSLPFISEVNSHLLVPPALSSQLREVGRGLKQLQGILRHQTPWRKCLLVPRPIELALPRVGRLLHQPRASSHEQSERGCALLGTGIDFTP